MSDPTISTPLLRLSDPWYISRLEVDVSGEAAQLYGEENIPTHRQADFAKLKRSDLATAEVWA